MDILLPLTALHKRFFNLTSCPRAKTRLEAIVIMTDLQETSQFHPFPRLPPEIRNLIWRATITPRVVLLRRHIASSEPFSNDLVELDGVHAFNSALEVRERRRHYREATVRRAAHVDVESLTRLRDFDADVKLSDGYKIPIFSYRTVTARRRMEKYYRRNEMFRGRHQAPLRESRLPEFSFLLRKIRRTNTSWFG